MSNQAKAADDRRSRVAASREEMVEQMTDSQRDTVERMESNGWHLCFMRDVDIPEPYAVVANLDSGAHGMVTVQGALEFAPTLHLRR